MHFNLLSCQSVSQSPFFSPCSSSLLRPRTLIHLNEFHSLCKQVSAASSFSDHSKMLLINKPMPTRMESPLRSHCSCQLSFSLSTQQMHLSACLALSLSQHVLPISIYACSQSRCGLRQVVCALIRWTRSNAIIIALKRVEWGKRPHTLTEMLV